MFIATVTSKTEVFGEIESNSPEGLAAKLAPDYLDDFQIVCADLECGEVPSGWPGIVEIGGGRYAEVRLATTV